MTEFNGWKYYKNALLPECAPDEKVDVTPVMDGSAWKLEGKNVIFARWTDDFDCEEKTNWWYVIKDCPFDIEALNSKKRYKINRGVKHFDVKRVDPVLYKDDIYNVQVESYSNYPAKYRPNVDKNKVYSTVENEWTKENVAVFIAFDRETNEAAGYIQLLVTGNCIESIAQKAIPRFEKFQVNYAMLYAVLEAYKEELKNGKYICVGSRNIQHETAFQDFVEDIFGFRKAYCRLNIAYNPKYRSLVKLLYPFKAVFGRLDGVGIVHKINGVLKMEEIVRQQKAGGKNELS